MGDFKSMLAAGFAAALLAGCQGVQIEEAKKASPTGSEFSNSLYGEYVRLSQVEYDEGDYRDSDYFARRAINAAANEPPQPEAISSRRLPADKAAELTAARERLMAQLDAGAREKMPAEAAAAQAMFDCWMQEQEENFQPEDIERCRGGLTARLEVVEAGLRPPPAAAAQEPAPAPEPVIQRFAVFFPFDSAELTPQSVGMVREAIDAAKQVDGAKVRLVGNTDTMGPQRYNLGLSERRIESVLDVMKQGGLPTTDIDLMALGKTNLPVPTPDNVPEQRNRRVEIVIEK